MMKNEELIKAVRYCVQHTNCDQCDFLISHNGRLICKAHGEKTLMLAIADSLEAIDRLFDQNTERCESLRKQLRDAHENYEKHIAELQQIADHHEQTTKDYWKEACEYKQRIAELEEQLPKHGEWVETEKKEWGIYPFKKMTCSVCDCEIDHIFMLACMDYFDDRDTAVFHYCPNCGAKMDGEEFEEPTINPCRGCEDYDGYGGCKSNGGCGRTEMDGERRYDGQIQQSS